MYTVAEIVERSKDAPRAWYGEFGDVHGMWILMHNTLYFRDDATGERTEVDLNEFRAHGIKYGQVDLVETARVLDGDIVYRTSKTLMPTKVA